MTWDALSTLFTAHEQASDCSWANVCSSLVCVNFFTQDYLSNSDLLKEIPIGQSEAQLVYAIHFPPVSSVQYLHSSRECNPFISFLWLCYGKCSKFIWQVASFSLSVCILPQIQEIYFRSSWELLHQMPLCTHDTRGKYRSETRSVATGGSGIQRYQDFWEILLEPIPLGLGWRRSAQHLPSTERIANPQYSPWRWWMTHVHFL